ncbi:MAG: hypothetical protein JWM85_1321 [Acidimicrobiaceae bacterium]|nr:hypothetical protein [Acidimicrobiaceae bacterium]
MATQLGVAPGDAVSAPRDLELSASGETWPRRAVAFLRRHPWAVALLAYAAIGLIANGSTWPGDAARIADCACGGKEDPAQTAWFLAWTPYALFHGHNPWLTGWIDLPAGANLAQNTSMPLLGLITSPLTLLVSPVASENLLRWLAFPLSAFAMFAVLRRWTSWAWAAFAGGLLYGFSPYMVGQASVHLNLSFVPLPPLIFYALYELVIRQQHSALRWGLIFGALSVAQFYVSPEILATTGLTAAVALVCLVIFKPMAVPLRAGHALAGLVVGGFVLAVLIAYPVYLMTIGPLHYSGPSQGVHEVFNADLLGPILPTVSQLVAPHRLANIGSALVGGRPDVDENGSYLGFPLLALVAYALVRYRRQRWIPFCVLMAAIMFVFSLGPSLTVDGKLHHLSFTLPFAYLRRLPLVQDVLPVRIALYVTFFVAVLLALGLDAFHDTLVRSRAHVLAGPRRGPRRALVLGEAVVGAAVGLVAVVSLLPRWPYPSLSATALPAESPAGLAAIPAGTAVLTYPYATQFTDTAMLWQADDGMRFKLFGSYILRRGARGLATALTRELLPIDVQAMFSETTSPIALPGLPYLEPTNRTIVATRVVVGDAPNALGGRPALSGVIANVNYATGDFYVIKHGLALEGVQVTAKTRYVEPLHHRRGINVLRADEVTVYGTSAAGTLGPRRVDDLRRFLRLHHVGAVLVQRGRVDSAAVLSWVREAIGAPTSSLRGGDLWILPKSTAPH